MGTNLQKYTDIFVKIFDVDRETLLRGFAFESEAKWDSLAHILLISELENCFDVLFDTEDILNYGSFENGKRILEKYDISFEE